MLLTGPGPRALGFVYMVIAAGTLPGAALAARAGVRFGQRRALGGSLATAIAGTVLLYLVPTSHVASIATYVLSGILGSILIPQFWTMVGTVLTVAQGRRLFGLISAAGIIGGVLGPAVASAALVFLPVKSLLLVSSLAFAVAFGALALLHMTERPGEFEPPRRVAIASVVQRVSRAALPGAGGPRRVPVHGDVPGARLPLQVDRSRARCRARRSDPSSPTTTSHSTASPWSCSC